MMTTRPGYIWSGTEWVSIGQEAIATPFKYQATEPTSPSTGDIWVDSDAVVSGVNTNDFLLKADVPTTAVYKMNTGSTTERPTGAAGLFRFNTTTGYPEWYDTETSTWLNFYQQKLLTIEYLVIAGGGAGASDGGSTPGNGGGGAGGYRSSITGEYSGGGAVSENALVLNRSTNYTVTIGAGGSGGSSVNRVNGNNSVFSTITSIAGGGGGFYLNNAGADGGSGGGGAPNGAAGGAGTTNQGYAGGAGGSGYGGNGGGAGSVATYSTSGNGLASSVTGLLTYRAGGGAGTGSTREGTAGLGGTAVYTAGIANTGAGGGAGRSGVPSGSGGSGIVILKYPSGFNIVISAGLTATTSIIGLNKVTTITAGTGTVSWS